MNESGKFVIIGVLGAVAIVGVTAITIVASNAVVKKANENADYALVQALSIHNTKATTQSESSFHECVATSGSETTESTKIVEEQDGQYYVDSRSVTPNSDGTVATCPDGSTIKIGTPIEINGVLYYPISYEDYTRLSPSRDGEYEVSAITKDRIYLVQKGDTLSKISGMVSFSVDELAEYNHIKNVDLIYEGEALRIPDER